MPQISDDKTNVPKATSRILLNPKTIKDRQNNIEAVEEYNKNHEDDIFEDIKSKGKKPLLKKKNLLEDSDSKDKNEVSVHSAQTPLSAYMRKA